MTSTESVNLQEIKGFVNIQLDVILNFAEYISGEKPSSKCTRIIAELRLFQRKFAAPNLPSTTIAESLDLQRKIMGFIIFWNPTISSQLLSLDRFHVDTNKLTTAPVTLRQTNPFRLILENRDRFLRGNQLIEDVFKKFFIRMADSVDVYSLFYCLIASVESIEYPLYKGFIEMLKQYKLEDKYDPNEIFSVTCKKKSDKGYKGYQTDSRMIRNALGHFDYLLNSNEHSFKITFYNPNFGTDSIEFDDTQFIKFIENHRFLMQSIMYIQIIMVVFSTLRVYFAIDEENKNMKK